VNLAQRTAGAVRRGFAAPPRLSLSQWADRYGWIAKSSGASEPGAYSTDRVPYMREILDVMGDETHRDVVFKKPAQVGFTEAINQFIASCMKADPSGVIVIQPDLERAKSWTKERIDPMLAESSALKNIVRSEGGRRTSDDTMLRKVFPGGWLAVVGANSASGLRSRPARRVLGDERSGWTLDARAQGDPWDLAVERTTTFWNAKRIQGSTPGEEGTCPITAALADSDLRRFHVTCPASGVIEPFQWKASDGTYRIVCDRDATDQMIPETARYLCMSCGVLIPEAEKAKMNRGGRWIAERPERETVGFDLGNALMSPWLSWGDIIRKWRDAQGNHERLKVFVTHVLAEPWKPVGERIDVHTLMARVEPLPDAPPAVALVTGAIDVQANRVETLTVGWAAGEESFVLDWQQHDGDPTASDDPWLEAWAALWKPLGAPLRSVAIDTGFLTSTAWKYVDKWNGARGVKVIGVKGEDGRGRPIIRRPRAVRRKAERPPWLVGVDSVKDLLVLRLPRAPGREGSVHFADTLDEVFFDQLTAEELRTVLVKGRPVKVWRPIAGRRNEALDLFVYCVAALHALGPKVVGQLRARPAQIQAAAEQAEAENQAPESESQQEPAPKPQPAPRKNAFVRAARMGGSWKLR
jgi:phage terminase large subunit GpA-like protein